MKWMNLITALMALMVIAMVAVWVGSEEQTHTVRIGVGARTSQAYELMESIKAVAERHDKKLNIEVFETRGSLHNAELMAAGSIDFATMLADAATGTNMRLVANLFPDSYQLIARPEHGIETVADLIGMRVAVPTVNTADYHEFIFLMNHYGLNEAEVEVVPGTQTSSDWAFLNRDVDALFRVRAPGNKSILSLIERTGAELVPIAQAPALKLRQPALSVSTIPTGSYRGHPPIPDHDLITASLDMLLVAREQVPESAVRRVTSILFERRRELVRLLPLAGQITQPSSQTGTFLPLHPGAELFYSKDEPSFLQEQAEPIALVMSVLAVVISGLLQLFSRRKKVLVDSYNQELLELAAKARAAARISTLEQYRQQLSSFVGRVVTDAASGRINSDQFDFFTFTYESVEQTINDREAELVRDQARKTAEASA